MKLPGRALRPLHAFRSPAALSRLALASIVANIGIVATGGAVRLTGSGLGCPTWPECSEGSYTPTGEHGMYELVEFGNRMLTFVVGLIAAAGLLAALAQRRRRPAAVLPAVLVFVGIPAQAVVGGVTVLTDLNPWVVGCHFLVSMAMITAAYVFWRRASDRPDGAPVPAPLRHLAVATAVVSAGVLVLGTVVTGSGPHAGDAGARRNGLDPESIAQLHTDAVFLLVGLSVGLWIGLRAAGADRAARAAAVLVGVELAQGLIGFVQYFTRLPAVLVGLHMIGASLVWLATVAVLAEMRRRPAPPGATVPAQHPAPSDTYPTLARITSANRSADPAAVRKNSDGSVSSNSISSGSPEPGTRSTRA